MADLDDLAHVAPLLMDSAYSAEISAILDRIPAAAVESHPRLAMAIGRRARLAGDRNNARRWYEAARASVGPDGALLARLWWELGCLDLEEDHLTGAEIALDLANAALGPHAESAADALHLDALIAERRGERARAMQQYRRAIALGDNALTLLTRVIALRNLASALTHQDPRSAGKLCALAIALIDGDDLDERTRPSVENVLAYSLLCEGRIEDGRLRAEAVAATASRMGHSLIEGYARFNACIALELLGAVDEADARLAEIERSSSTGSDVFAGWVQLRRAWLSAKSGRSADARAYLERDFATAVRGVFGRTVSTLGAILNHRAGSAQEAAGQLQDLVEAYIAEEDWVTAFALLLWLACVHERAADASDARAAVAAAIRIGRQRGIRLSPNWWSDELVDVARRFAAPADAYYTGRLIAGSGTLVTAEPPRTVIFSDGAIHLDGNALSDSRWRIGRSGSRILRRLFALLVSTHPIGLERDELADLLWPESDGDRAIQNLDAALNDLRRFLRDIGGVHVAFEGGRYHLSTAAWVLVVPSPARAQVTVGVSAP